jgi:adenosine deaminase
MHSREAFPHYHLADLHAHLGTSISPAILWEIAQDMGFVLPRRDYHDFVKYITISPQNPIPLERYFDTIYHKLLDKLSSGTKAVERGVYETFSGAYRANKIRLLELRTNPMKHNYGAEVDLDQLIMAMLRGMEKALLSYPRLSGGLIFCLGREFNYEKNKIIVEKAIKYRTRGVVGIDLAGPYNSNFAIEEYGNLFEMAHGAGLGVTAHSGEQRSPNDMWKIIEILAPKRIGHGIFAAYDAELMKELIRRDIVLEICPLSNLATEAVKNVDEIRHILRTFIANGVKFTINTDWPEVIENNHLCEEFEWLLSEKILNEDELKMCNNLAFERSFVRGCGIDPYL